MNHVSRMVVIFYMMMFASISVLWISQSPLKLNVVTVLLAILTVALVSSFTFIVYNVNSYMNCRRSAKGMVWMIDKFIYGTFRERFRKSVEKEPTFRYYYNHQFHNVPLKAKNISDRILVLIKNTMMDVSGSDIDIQVKIGSMQNCVRIENSRYKFAFELYTDDLSGTLIRAHRIMFSNSNSLPIPYENEDDLNKVIGRATRYLSSGDS